MLKVSLTKAEEIEDGKHRMTIRIESFVEMYSVQRSHKMVAAARVPRINRETSPDYYAARRSAGTQTAHGCNDTDAGA